jgi:uncharacterized protein YyaL (SSP411 family)
MSTQQDNYPANLLAQETSPYLLQHAHNPVAWHPWNDAALELARREGKPILLSIGYSACHWCHVMAHESFEDQATADTMNALFVNIKVDREERPDLDKIYQLAHQLLSRRSGGWPLTVFLNPVDLLPFFTGTYFPKESRYSLPGFVSVLEKVSAYYYQNQDKLSEGKESFVNALNSMSESQGASSALDAGLLSRVSKEMEKGFDPIGGGFGGAPKFPHPTTLEFLLRHHARSGDAQALRMALFSLRKMAQGGIYDQLGGGFCRYSTDAEWNIPHFEKMLYDNGPLLALFCHAWQITGTELFRDIATATAEWSLREMQSPEGGFYSSLDADSEGVEGRFYAWDRRDVQSLLTEQEFALLALHYGLGDTPNFEGQWHLFVALPLEESADRLGIDIKVAGALLDSARRKLFAQREARVRPGRDDKILTSWNALMIKGMAIAGRVLERGDFIVAALQALTFLRTEAFRDGKLLATWKEGRARFPAYLDDYAFLLDATMELLQSHWDKSMLEFAIILADDLLARFEDKAGGGFFFTAHDHESLIHRPKSMTDESMPAGNALAAFALNRLGHLLGCPRYSLAAERTLQASMTGMGGYPQAYGAMLNALDEWSSPPQTVVIRGTIDEMGAWQRLALERYSPNRLCLAIPAGESGLPGLLEERRTGTEMTATVCEAGACLPPVRSLEEFQRLVNA